jgi:3-dehydroquinate dehydratase-2
MKKILVIHGPNLQLLGQRETAIYGVLTMEEINKTLEAVAASRQAQLTFFQSNHEGGIVDRIGVASAEGFAGIVINPAAYTHTSVAIRDAVSASPLPVVEVHLSNIHKREEFRHHSIIAPAACGQISGFGAQSYVLGLMAVIGILESH